MKKLLALVLAIAMTLSFTAALADNTLTMATNATSSETTSGESASAKTAATTSSFLC